MADTERHVKRFVFGRLLPVRGVERVWERRYGWHWVVEKEAWVFDCQLQCKVANGWEATAWLHEVKPKKRADLSCPPPP